MRAKLTILLTALLVSGCATLFSSETDDIIFTSDPPNIKVYKDSRYIGTTPMTVTVKRVGMASARLDKFRFEKEGYRSQEFTLTTEFNNVALLNNITIVSWLTDFFTGTVTQYAPTKYHVILENKNEVGFNDFSTRKMAQQYILLFFSDIIKDAYTGGGIHTDNLIDILKVNTADRPQFVDLVKSSVDENTTPPELITNIDGALKYSAQLAHYSFL